MVIVESLKTKKQQQFTNENWEIAKGSGLAKKYKVVSELSAPVVNEVVRFTPPEIKEKKTKVEKPTVNKNKS